MPTGTAPPAVESVATQSVATWSVATYSVASASLSVCDGRITASVLAASGW